MGAKPEPKKTEKRGADTQMNITVVTIHSKYKCEPKFFNKNSSKTCLL